MRRYSWWVRPVSGGNIFLRNTEALPTYSARTVRNKEELSLHATMDLVGPSRQALHVQSSSDDSRMLTTPLRESWIRGSSDSRTMYFRRTVGL